MEYELIFSARSEEDTRTAIDYYDHINPQLGERFLLSCWKPTENYRYHLNITLTYPLFAILVFAM